MKNSITLLLITFLSFGIHAQKKGAKTSKTSSSTLAKIDNLVVEVKNNMFQISISDKGKTTNTISIKPVTSGFKPTNCKLTSFTANGVKLYALYWDENTSNKTDTKTENIVTTNSKIYEMSSQKEVFSNSKLVNNITEKVFLDKNKTASETQDKIRREGFDLVINADGTISQKGKNQENKFSYDAASMSFVDFKKKK